MTTQILREVTLVAKSDLSQIKSAFGDLGELVKKFAGLTEAAGTAASTAMQQPQPHAEHLGLEVKQLAQSFERLTVVANAATLGMVEPLKIAGEAAAGAVVKVEALEHAFGSLGKSLLFFGGTAMLAGLGVVLTRAIEVGKEEIGVNAALENSYRQAGLQLATYRDEIERSSVAMTRLGFTEGDTKTAITEATTAHVKQAEIMRSLPVVADLARAKHISLAEAMQQFVLAMQGHGKALAEYNIHLDSTSMKIGSMFNPTAQFAYITEALQKKIGGAAEAAAKADPWMAFNAQLNMIYANLSALVLPAMTALGGVLAGLTDYLVTHQAAMTAVSYVIGGVLVAALAAATVAMVSFTIATLSNPIVLIIAGVVALGVALFELVTHWQQVVDWLQRTWNEIENRLAPALGHLAILFDNPVGDALKYVVKLLQDLVDWLTEAWNKLTKLMQPWVMQITAHLPDWSGSVLATAAIAAALVAAGFALAALLPELIGDAAAAAGLAAALGTAGAAASGMDGTLADILSKLNNILGLALATAAAFAAMEAAALAIKAVQFVVSVVWGTVSSLLSALGTIATWAGRTVSFVLSVAWGTLSAAWHAVTGLVGIAAKGIHLALSAAWGALKSAFDAGHWLSDLAKKGLHVAVAATWGTLKAAWDGAKGLAHLLAQWANSAFTLTVNLAGTAADLLRRGADAGGGIAGALGSIGGAIGSLGGALGSLVGSAIPVKASASGPFKVTSVDWSAVLPLRQDATIHVTGFHLPSSVGLEVDAHIKGLVLKLPSSAGLEVDATVKGFHVPDHVKLEVDATVKGFTVPSHVPLEVDATIKGFKVPTNVSLEVDAHVTGVHLPKQAGLEVPITFDPGKITLPAGLKLKVPVVFDFSGIAGQAATGTTDPSTFAAAGQALAKAIGDAMKSHSKSAQTGIDGALVDFAGYISGQASAHFHALGVDIDTQIGLGAYAHAKVAFPGLGNFLTSIGGWLKDNVKVKFAAIENLAGVVAGWVGGQTGLNFKDAGPGMGTFLTNIGGWIKDHVAHFFGAVAGLGSTIPSWIAARMSDGANLLLFAQPVMDWATEIYNDVLGLGKEWTKIADALFSGLGKAISDGWAHSPLKAALDGLGAALPGPIRSALGIKSPSTVFYEMGRYMMEGLAGGIADHHHLPQAALNGLRLNSPGLARVAGGGFAAAGGGGGGITIGTVHVYGMQDATGLDRYLRQFANQAARY